MIRKVGWMVGLSLLFASTAISAPIEQIDEVTAEQSCKNWAKEDGIRADGMSDYMQLCLAQLHAGENQYSEVAQDIETYEELAGNGPQFDEEYFQESNTDPAEGTRDITPKKKYK